MCMLSLLVTVHRACSMQAAVGNVLAALVPKAQLVPAVTPEHMSQDPAVVRTAPAPPSNFRCS
jgi:hypothetical protein